MSFTEQTQMLIEQRRVNRLKPKPRARSYCLGKNLSDSIDYEFKVPALHLRIHKLKVLQIMTSSGVQAIQQCMARNDLYRESPFSIFLHKGHENIKILHQDRDPQTQLQQRMDNNYNFLCKIVPKYHFKMPCFDVILQTKNLPVPESDIDSVPFLHLKSGALNHMMLQSGDIIKIGASIFKVTIVDEFFQPPKQPNQFFQLPQQPNVKWQSQTKSQPQLREGMCRICLFDNQDTDDYIISPCSCTGSCAFVHVNCLRHWLNLRLQKWTSNQAVAYSLSGFICQICKTPLPRYLQLNNQRIQLLPLGFKSFVSLQSLLDEDKLVYVIPYKEGKPVKIQIGRALWNDVVLRDESVFHTHAELNIYGGGGVGIQSTNNCAGIYVSLRRSIQVLDNVTIFVKKAIFNVVLKEEL